MAKGDSKDLRERAVVMVEEESGGRSLVYSTLLPLQQCVGLTGGTERAALRRNQASGTVARRSRRTSSGCSISWRRSRI